MPAGRDRGRSCSRRRGRVAARRRREPDAPSLPGCRRVVACVCVQGSPLRARTCMGFVRAWRFWRRRLSVQQEPAATHAHGALNEGVPFNLLFTCLRHRGDGPRLKRDRGRRPRKRNMHRLCFNLHHHLLPFLL